MGDAPNTPLGPVYPLPLIELPRELNFLLGHLPGLPFDHLLGLLQGLRQCLLLGFQPAWFGKNIESEEDVLN